MVSDTHLLASYKSLPDVLVGWYYHVKDKHHQGRCGEVRIEAAYILGD